MTDRVQLLVRQLAEEDAIFFAPRKHQWSTMYPRHAFQMRQAFFAAGLPWRSGERSNATRISSMRALDAAVAEGLAEATKGGSSFPLVRLTEAGEGIARPLVALLGAKESLGLASRVSGKAKSKRRWIAETALAPRTAVGLLDLAFLALPALRRRWLETHSDLEGRVYYRVGDTPSSVLPADDEEATSPCVEAAELYARTMRQATARLSADPPPDPQDIAPIPLSPEDLDR